MAQFWPNFKSRFLGPSWADSWWHLSRQHLHCQHLSISVISQLLLTPFWPNFLDSFFAGRNSFYQSFFLIKILFDPNFFDFKFVPTIFCTQNPKNLDPIFLCNQNVMDPRFCGPKIFGLTYQPEIILKQNKNKLGLNWAKLCSIGCVIKWKNEVCERALWNQVVLVYKETESKEKNWILIFYLPHFSLKKFLHPFIGQKNNSSDYRLHGTQNDRLEPTVSTQKSLLKNMHWVLRY